MRGIAQSAVQLPHAVHPAAWHTPSPAGRSALDHHAQEEPCAAVLPGRARPAVDARTAAAVFWPDSDRVSAQQRGDTDLARGRLSSALAQARRWGRRTWQRRFACGWYRCLPPSEAHTALNEVRSLAESTGRKRLLEQVIQLEAEQATHHSKEWVKPWRERSPAAGSRPDRACSIPSGLLRSCLRLLSRPL